MHFISTNVRQGIMHTGELRINTKLRERLQACVHAYGQVVDRRANLHDGLARVDRTAGDTWGRPRGEVISLVQVKQISNNEKD